MGRMARVSRRRLERVICLFRKSPTQKEICQIVDGPVNNPIVVSSTLDYCEMGFKEGWLGYVGYYNVGNETVLHTYRLLPPK